MAGSRKLGRASDHRKAMLRAMVTYCSKTVKSKRPLQEQKKFVQ